MKINYVTHPLVLSKNNKEKLSITKNKNNVQKLDQTYSNILAKEVANAQKANMISFGVKLTKNSNEKSKKLIQQTATQIHNGIERTVNQLHDNLSTTLVQQTIGEQVKNNNASNSQVAIKNDKTCQQIYTKRAILDLFKKQMSKMKGESLKIASSLLIRFQNKSVDIDIINNNYQNIEKNGQIKDIAVNFYPQNETIDGIRLFGKELKNIKNGQLNFINVNSDNPAMRIILGAAYHDKTNNKYWFDGKSILDSNIFPAIKSGVVDIISVDPEKIDVISNCKNLSYLIQNRAKTNFILNNLGKATVDPNRINSLNYLQGTGLTITNAWGEESPLCFKCTDEIVFKPQNNVTYDTHNKTFWVLDEIINSEGSFDYINRGYKF